MFRIHQFVLVIAVNIAFATVAQCTAQILPKYQSVPESNPDRFLKVVARNADQLCARLEIYNRSKNGFSRVANIELPHVRFPNKVTVSPDGRFVVCLGNMLALSFNKGAVTIVDMELEKAKSFELNDLFSPEEIKVLTKHSSGFYWHRDCLATFSGADTNSKITLESNVASRPLGKIISINLNSHEIEFIKLNDTTGLAREKIFQTSRLLRLATELMDGPQYTRFFFVNKFTSISPTTVQYQNTANGVAQLIPGSSEDGIPPKLRLLRSMENESYSQIKSIELNNSVLPLDWHLSPNQDFLLTLDEWDQIGKSNNTIGIYEIQGERQKTFALEDILSPLEIANLEFQENNYRLWRFGNHNVKLINSDWQLTTSNPMPGLPVIHIDLQAMTANGAATKDLLKPGLKNTRPLESSVGN